MTSLPDENVAYVLETPGSPLNRASRRLPTPVRGQALVRNLATSVNYHDVLNVQGLVPFVLWPRVPYSDNCSEIVALGPEPGSWQVGDRVLANFFVDWIDGPPNQRYCSRVYGDQNDGFLQDYTLVETASLVIAPAHLTAGEVATLGCAGLTAWRSVVVEAGVGPGDVVVIQGTGGVSLFALQFAKMVGSEVILLSSSEEKLAFGRTLGADHVHNYREDPAWDAAVMDFTGGRGANLVVEIGGADTMARSLNAVCLNGHVSVIGIRTGAGLPAAMPIEQILIRNITVRGMTVGSRRQLEQMCAAMTVNRMCPVIDRHFGIEDTEAAMALMESQSHRGKIVIDIAGETR